MTYQPGAELRKAHVEILMFAFPFSGEPIAPVREDLKRLLLGRDMLCRGCNGPFKTGVHMHEGVISRAEVQGWRAEDRVLIYVPFNCVLLCADCNLGQSGKHAPARDRILSEHAKLYGTRAMVEWAVSLPFKVHPLRGWLEMVR